MNTLLLFLTTSTLLTAVHLTAADADKPKADAAQPAPKPKAETYLTIEKSGRDYTDQGEFLNDWGGAQVIALGEDKFRLVTYKGGLPGAGWDKETKTQVEGKRDGDKIAFAGPNEFKAELSGGELSITTADGGPWAMKKTSRTSPTLGAKPPADATLLFDTGMTPDQFAGGHLEDRGFLAAGCKTKKAYQNFSMHCEFLLPFKPLGRGQDRGNSGVYLQDRYEVQVLDSFGLKGENNECGGIYTKAKPAVNMCFPPLVWQTYDIDFTAAQFDADGKKTKNAVATVRHNGVVIHDKFEINGPTASGQPEGPTPGPIQLQGHGNPVFYRNIWVLEK